MEVTPKPTAAPEVSCYVFPASFAQRRLWFLQQLEPAQTSYLVPMAWKIVGELNVAAVEFALNRLVERHDTMRTSFAVDGEEPVQVVQTYERFTIRTTDVSSCDDPAGEALKLTGVEANTPFDLLKSPLFRCRLLHLGAREHVLLFTTHHIVFDGWSKAVWMQEFTAFYRQKSTGDFPSAVRELEIQYGDFASWQQENLSGAGLERQVAFWKEALCDAPLLLELPRDRPRSRSVALEGARVPLVIESELAASLRALARTTNSSLFMVLLAGFYVLLSRYTGVDDVLVGTPTANRERLELEPLIGFFINTLVMRGRVEPAATFLELLAEVKTYTLDAFAHQDMPFEKLVELLQPERSLSYNPVYQVMFALQNTPREPAALPGLSISAIPGTRDKTNLDLFLSIADGPDRLQGVIEYSAALFDETTVERMATHYVRLLESIVENPSAPVLQIEMLTESERQRILVEWNDTASSYPRDETLIGIIQARAWASPGSLAVVSENYSFTYGELEERANSLAGRLIAAGVEGGDRVGVFLDRTPELIVALLGVMKAGAAYVPLDPNHPVNRIQMILEDAEVSCLLTQRELAKKLAAYAGRLVCVDDEATLGEGQSAFRRRTVPSADDLAYVIFTSGSTGRPKGVEIPHRAVVNLLQWMAQELDFGPGDVFPALASFGFDMSIPELFLPLFTGGKVVLGGAHLAGDGVELARFLRKHGAGVVHATPTTWALLLDAGFNAKGLRRCVGAEPLPQGLFDRLMTIAPGEPLWNFYGPTETTVWSTFQKFTHAQETIVIGRPVANTQIYILNSRGQVCPVGVAGEIHIAGDGLAVGYRSQVELSREKFVRNPFSADSEARMYKTADLGRWRADGTIEHLGRADYQVKIRGYRIELGEIEAALSVQPGVREAAVIVREDVPGDKRLVAYVGTEIQLDQAELRARLKSVLPEYMVPVAFHCMDRLPLTPNGKVDRKALPEPAYTGASEAPPATPTEEALLPIWTKILRLEKAGVEDNFFESGGHSLLATQLVSRIAMGLHVDVPVRLVFESPTIRGLGMEIDRLLGEGSITSMPALQTVDRGRAWPLSFAQQRFWVLSRLNPKDSGYNVKTAVRIAGALDQSVLERCLDVLYARNEGMRTTYEVAGGVPAQAIRAASGPRLEVVSVSGGEQEVVTLAAAAAAVPIQLSTGPVCRFVLYRLSNEDHVLLLISQHICMDGASTSILFEDLATLYDQLSSGEAAALPRSAFDYLDFAAWQRGWMQGKVLEDELRFWCERLQGLPAALQLPFDYEGEPGSFSGAIRSIMPGLQFGEMLLAFCRGHQVTPFTVLLWGLGVLLHRWTEQQSFAVGTVAGNRPVAELDRVFGCFLNMLPLRMDISGTDTALDLLWRTRATVLDGFSHGHCPYDAMVDALRVERAPGRNPIFNVGLLLQNFSELSFETKTLVGTSFGFPREAALLDLRFIASVREDRVRIACEYKQTLFKPETIDALLDGYTSVLAALLKDPDVKVAEVPIPGGLQMQAEQSQRTHGAVKVVVSATFTAEPVEEPLHFWLGELEIKHEIEFAPFNQIFQELLNPASGMRRNRGGINVLLVRFEDWLRMENATAMSAQGHIRRSIDDLMSALEDAAAGTGANFLLCYCPVSRALAGDPQWSVFLNEVEREAMQRRSKTGNVQIITASQIGEVYPVSQYEDVYAEKVGNVPYTKEYFTALATMVTRRIWGICGTKYKVIVLDCDNTLWSGVCGEDGPLGVKVDAARAGLQEFVRQQREQGMLLCLASKNTESDVWEVFQQNPAMILGRNDITAYRINWKRKSDNIREIAEELGLGLDSFVFIDDNPIECAEMEVELPQVLTLQLPDKASQIPQFLKHVWAFDHFSTTETDYRRSELYQDDQVREQSRQGQTLDEFIEGLELDITFSPLSEESVSRVAQLTQRSNQFNLTTVRRQDYEVRALLQHRDLECITVSLSDRFGEYGLIGVVTYGFADASLVVETFLMSCRALGRRVEHAVLARLAETARCKGATWVELPFLATEKNKPANNFLENLEGATRRDEGKGMTYRVSALAASQLYGRRLVGSL